MNKKRLLALPVIGLVVAMFSVAVLAASPAKGFKVYDKNMKDVTSEFNGEAITTTTFDPSTISGIQDALTAKDKDLKVGDFKYVIGYDIEPKGTAADTPYTVEITVDLGENEYAIVVHLNDDGSLDRYEIVKGKASYVRISSINSLSPFLVFKASVKASAQTGEYAAPYIIMISVALVSCGAIFAIRAKKATK